MIEADARHCTFSLRACAVGADPLPPEDRVPQMGINMKAQTKTRGPVTLREPALICPVRNA